MEFLGEISTCSFGKGVITVVCIVFGVQAADITWVGGRKWVHISNCLLNRYIW